MDGPGTGIERTADGGRDAAEGSGTDHAAAAAAAAVVRGGGEAAFGALLEGHRRELRVHCYRMLGSLEDAEDQVQETFLRAFRGRAGFEGRSTVRAWLYRIATNACLDFLDRHPRRPQPRPEPALATPGVTARSRTEVPWLRPFPDVLLEPAGPPGEQPDAALVARETIELAFLAAIQHLPPRQRVVVILRDVLGWPAPETAELLDTSVAAVKSALQRARPVLREHLPADRGAWAPATEPTAEEREVLRRYITAVERADPEVLAAVLRKDALQTMPPAPIWILGGPAIVANWTPAMVGPQAWGDWRLVPTAANRQPAAAAYLRRPGDTAFRASWLAVLRVEDGLISEITTFGEDLFPAFGLPPVR
ncbi:RNA polymerase sigma factor [Sphaerisporangium rufum]|uniref:RNA polymerase sigma factor n=1 Tax=Sphaerisporangium rufum TaxID=1381558 RepID=A0A919UYU8_9ACTN|nr:RNA polymerase subunit sigma-70 [Sphaerisporangium rufum]GII77144.1 RNA polymerase sigma factor [Sphaerisporangium rufum]